MTKINKLTILKEFYKKDGKSNRLFVECLCDCGSITVGRKDFVFNGRKQSCGCLINERIRELKVKPLGVSAFNSLLTSYKRSAKLRGLSFNLSIEEFKIIISLNCYYCNKEPENKVFNKSQTPIKTNGIDRQNNLIGYTVENCKPCCKICNMMKSTLSEQEFYEHIRKIMENTSAK